MRKNVVIPLVCLVVLVIIFNVFFLDKVIRATIIKIGEAIFQAKVEISELKTKFSNLSVKISGLAIADKDNPMRNLLEVENIYFGILPRPLLEGKFVIERMEISGIATSTVRKTSGALPPKKLKKISRRTTPGIFDKVWEKSSADLRKTIVFNLWPDGKNISRESVKEKVEALETLNTISRLRGESEKKISDYESSWKSLSLAEVIKETTDNLNAAKNIRINNVGDLPAAENLIKKLQSNQQKINATVKGLSQLKNSISAELDIQDYLKQINQAKDRDYQNTLGKVNLSGLSTPAAIGKSLLGPAVVGKIDKGIYYLGLIKKYIPKKRGTTRPQQIIPRRRGTDFVFVRKNFWPKLWIKKVVVSGQIAYTDFSGEVSDITTSQEIINRPTLIKIAGRSKSGSLLIDGFFDYRQDPDINRVNILLTGMPQPEYSLPGEIKLTGRKMDSQSIFLLAGSSFTARLELKIDEPEFKSTQEVFWLKYLQNVPTLEVSMSAEKVTDGFKIDFRSNVDGILKQRIGDELRALLESYQARIYEEIDRQVKEKRDELLQDIENRKKEILARYDSEIENIQSKEKDIQKSIDEIKAQLQQQASKSIDEKKIKELKNLLPR